MKWEKSGFPYSVDLLLADFCPFRNEFCYGALTQTGKYANYYNVLDVINKLNRLKVFEINFGGGEPTLYQDKESGFVDILKQAKELGFKIGFVTKNYFFDNDTVNFFNILKYTDKITVIAETREELQLAFSMAKKIQESAGKIIEMAVQTTLFSDFEKLIEWLNEYEKCLVAPDAPIVNLSFISDTRPVNSTNWISLANKLINNFNIKVGIDIFIIEDCEAELIAQKMPFHLVGTEGKQTCLVDAVNNVMKPNAKSTVEISFDSRAHNLKHEYAKL